MIGIVLLYFLGELVLAEDYFQVDRVWGRWPQQTRLELPQPPTRFPYLLEGYSGDVKCLAGLPSALSFVEPLSIDPDEVLIFSGGDSLMRRQTGFGSISSTALKDFASHHGYQLIFLDQIGYNKTLIHAGIQFKPQWHRVFAMPELRVMFPDAKYFVWFDDDILVPYKETDTLNHYINLMEADPEWEMLYGSEGAEYVLNSGLFIMKNSDFSFQIYQETLEVALEENGRLAYNQHMEQEAIAIIRDRHSLHHRIRVIDHRQGPYNFNTFARDCSWDPPGVKWEYGDAFVHFLGAQEKAKNMKALQKQVSTLKKRQPNKCTYPIPLKHS